MNRKHSRSNYLFAVCFLALMGINQSKLCAQVPAPPALFSIWGGIAGPDCPDQGSTHDGTAPYSMSCIKPDRIVTAFTRGDGEPEAQYRVDINNGPPEPNGGAFVNYFLYAEPLGTDPFGALDLVPVVLPWRVSLIATTNNGRAVSQARIELRGINTGEFYTLLSKTACSTSPGLVFYFCPGGSTTLFVTEEGESRFNLLGRFRYTLQVSVATTTNTENSENVNALLSAWIDPLPRLDDSINPADLNRPPNWRLSDHYRIIFSPNILRTPCEVFCNDFENSGEE